MKRLSPGMLWGAFPAGGPDALESVRPGQTIELNGRVELGALQTGFRMFLWFVNEVRNKNPLFADGADLKALQEQEKTVKFMLGKRDEINATLTPQGDAGPAVGVTFLNEWLIESVGRWNGTYTLIGQVEEVLPEGASWQTMRIIEDAPRVARSSPARPTPHRGAVDPCDLRP